MTGRRAGVSLPLFSFPSTSSWGIGEICDIPLFSEWLRAAGLRVLQLLPINEMPPGETSPYSALSAMAIDPQFITLEHVEDFAEIGGEQGLEGELRRELVRSLLRYVECIHEPLALGGGAHQLLTARAELLGERLCSLFPLGNRRGQRVALRAEHDHARLLLREARTSTFDLGAKRLELRLP